MIGREVSLSDSERCARCGGEVVMEWVGPGQAFWVCEACGDSDLALHNPPRPHTFTCRVCGEGYYQWTPVTDPICSECRAKESPDNETDIGPAES